MGAWWPSAWASSTVDGTDDRRSRTRSGHGPSGARPGRRTASRLTAGGWYERGESANGIFLVDAADGGDPTRLTTNDAGGHDIPGDFSPDGRHLTFQRAYANGNAAS